MLLQEFGMIIHLILVGYKDKNVANSPLSES